MLSPDRIHDIFSRIRKFSSADEVEAIIAGGHSALTRFANNTIHQNVAEEGYVISIRVAMDHKTPPPNNRQNHHNTPTRAEKTPATPTRGQTPDPPLLPTPPPAAPKEAQPLHHHFGATAATRPVGRAAAVTGRTPLSPPTT